mmetsp:Transcript_857/g.1787  ORF Transcript_857/g.1787 Transcript_857/m.1787 type:complete len:202 (+) Transcript_857:273-878(+)|eukprot:CAMPEP_0197176834 /NCGR_PEP_ID=MMETSP1423-20130617/2623_1 /TAXON_ID=476441 /ORGANISM="Pseudo-nitzschia heimii, Strain UNC1101" /LENGTH=201 /DNA_ID=CAMNT_0042626261 /DNA_START=216 /DNA_END=821 /DNA_ORIENTATION=+
MTVNKHAQSNNNMLFVLASLACGQNDTRSAATIAEQPIPKSRVVAVSDTSDDDTSTIETASSRKERIVARRRRRPIKKRIPMGDNRSTPLLFLDSSIKSKKSLLETSIEIICRTRRKSGFPLPNEVESNNITQVSAIAPVPDQDNTNNDSSQESDNEIPTLVNDDDAWKDVHSPLDLPSFLPCPTSALKDVKSICLTLEER